MLNLLMRYWFSLFDFEAGKNFLSIYLMYVGSGSGFQRSDPDPDENGTGSVTLYPGLTQVGQMSPLRPLKFCPTLLLYYRYTVNFGLIDVKQTQQESCVSQLSAERNKSN